MRKRLLQVQRALPRPFYRAASVGLAFAPSHRQARVASRTGTIKRATINVPLRLPRPDYQPAAPELDGGLALVLPGPWGPRNAEVVPISAMANARRRRRA